MYLRPRIVIPCLLARDLAVMNGGIPRAYTRNDAPAGVSGSNRNDGINHGNAT